MRLVGLALVAIGLALPSLAKDGEHVILIHGLWRTSRSMEPMQKALEREGYQVLNLDYPSRTAAIEELSEELIGPAIESCIKDGAKKVHFVTHSLGGILVRSYFSRHSPEIVGRVVMLGPPNQGSEAIDAFGELPFFDKIMGPAARELGTDVDSAPNTIGKPAFVVGIIAGNRSFNPVGSAIIPGRDDSKVSVESTKLDGMTDHIVLAATHPFIMRNHKAIRSTIEFLVAGRFDHVKEKQQRTGVETNRLKAARLN
jgi:pimeloyl-ACP methyl ester carboxylesterase